MSDKKVVVVLPVYNVLPFLQDCKDALDAQTTQDFDIIAVDDGSTDASLDFLHAWERDNPRLLVLEKENGGLSSARNAALDYLAEKRAGGAGDSIIIFLDSDDLLEPRCVEQVAQKMNQEDLDICEFEGRALYENERLRTANAGLDEWLRMHGDYSSTVTGPQYLERSGVGDQKSCTWLRAYRTNYLLNEGLRFPDGLLHEDIYFAFATVLRAKRAACLHEVFYIYRIREGSITTLKKDWANLKGRFFAEKQMLQELDERLNLTQEQARVAQGIIEECIVSNYMDYLRLNPDLVREQVEHDLTYGDQLLFYKLLEPSGERKGEVEQKVVSQNAQA